MNRDDCAMRICLLLISVASVVNAKAGLRLNGAIARDAGMLPSSIGAVQVTAVLKAHTMEEAAESTQSVKIGLARLRSETSALQHQTHDLLDAFGQTVLDVDGLYYKAHQEMNSATKNLRLADRLCGALANCGECSRAAICGWCVDENRCVPGDALGTYEGVQLQCNTYHFAKCD
mmetsp:Transcript_25582/g.41008  ORF Transcript_25582/g.41008 Transcript_25582/m.41008 type:complete len:175 (-) Transcript_25582:54-578(-)